MEATYMYMLLLISRYLPVRCCKRLEGILKLANLIGAQVISSHLFWRFCIKEVFVTLANMDLNEPLYSTGCHDGIITPVQNNQQ